MISELLRRVTWISVTFGHDQEQKPEPQTKTRTQNQTQNQHKIQNQKPCNIPPLESPLPSPKCDFYKCAFNKGDFSKCDYYQV